MSLFDALVRDFFGADPFLMRAQNHAPQRPVQVHRVTHMVEGLVVPPQGGGPGPQRTFRHISYSSGSKSMNNINSAGNHGKKSSVPALTYTSSAPKPVNPDRVRCSSVCEGWKNSLRHVIFKKFH